MDDGDEDDGDDDGVVLTIMVMKLRVVVTMGANIYCVLTLSQHFSSTLHGSLHFIFTTNVE